MQTIIDWLSQYWYRNYTDILHGIVFAAVTLFLVFKDTDRSTKIKKCILSFLVSYNTAEIISYATYAGFTSFLSIQGTFLDFLLASGCLLLPVFILIPLYAKVLAIQGPGAAFLYALFFCSNCLAMLLAQSVWQRMCITIALSIALTWYFQQEIRYLFFEKSMLQMDHRFQGTAYAFMVLIGVEAELPRIVLDGSPNGFVNALAYGVSIAGIALILFFVFFMKFNFFAIMKYENYIRSQDEDSTTGAKSLTYLIEHGRDMILKAQTTNEEFAVFYTNLENLHDVNMIHGYDAGTKILQKTAALLAAQFPDGIVARVSGSHFAGIIPLANIENKFNVAAKQIEGLSLDEALHLKVGIYLIPVATHTTRHETELSYDELTTMVDLSAYAVRYQKDSRQVVQYFEEDLKKQEEIRLHVISSIDKAVQNQWLRVYYQPLIHIQSGKPAGFEALYRWEDPVYGLLTPDKFVPSLENLRLIYKVDLNVLSTYGREIQKIQKIGLEPLPISFNISRTDLESGIDLYGEIERIVNALAIDKNLIHIEITESALNGDSLIMPQAIEHFHRMGFEVWMDDFGSGYSSLNVLKDYPFDVIKIDMEFMKKFDERSKQIVRSICEMATSLGTRTVAEGVETKEQLQFLQQIGCTYAQGYLFSKPKPVQEFFSLLPKRPSNS